MDMLNGPLAGKILLFAMPLALSSILQQLFNAADVAVAGRFAGHTALAAVGSNSPVVALFFNSFVGLAVGANVVIAQYIGQENRERITDVVHTAILFGVMMGVCLTVVGQLVAGPLLTLMGAPEEFLGQAILYFRIFSLGMPFFVVYNFGAAILRSVGDTKRPMYCLIFSGILNVALNLLLVIVFKLGVAGVAIATVTAGAVSCLLVLRMLSGETSDIALDFRKLRIDGDSLRHIVRIGGPAAIQSMVFSLSNICIQSGVNSFQTYAVAGSAAATNFEIFDYFMVASFNQAAITFIGQNFAAGKYDRCKKISVLCMVECVACVLLMISLFFGFKSFWIGLYTTEATVAEYAGIRMQIVLSFHFLICSYEILGSVLRGMGKSMLPAVITIIGSVCFRIAWLLTVFAQNHTLETLYLVYPVSWILTGSMMLTAFLITVRKVKLQNQKTTES